MIEFELEENYSAHIDVLFPYNVYENVILFSVMRYSTNETQSWPYGHKFSQAETGLWFNDPGLAPICGNHTHGNGDNPSFIQNLYDFWISIPPEHRGHLTYFEMSCNALTPELAPNSRTRFKNLFGV